MFATALLALAATTANAGTDDALYEVPESFDGYSDASELGADILPASMRFADGSFLTGSDGVTRAVLEVDYLDGAWIVITEDECTGKYNDGCLTGYAIEAAMVVTTAQLDDEGIRQRVQVYANDEGLQYSGTIDISSATYRGDLWVTIAGYDASGDLVDSDQIPVGQGLGEDIGGALGAIGGFMVGEAIGAGAGFVIGKHYGGRFEEWVTSDSSTDDESDEAAGNADETKPEEVDTGFCEE